MTETAFSTLPYRPNVGVMIINGAGRIWAGRRIDNPGDAWQMPQGGIDPGESAEQAALRELEEETAIPADAVEIVAETADWLYYDLPPDLIAKLWKGRYRGQQQKWFLLRFTGGDELVNIETEHPEFSHWAWMDYATLLDKIVPFKRDVYAAIWAEFGPLVERRNA